MPLSKSSKPWEEVYNTSHEVMERMQIPGGWLYRNRVLQGSDSVIEHIALAFAREELAGNTAPINRDPPYVSNIGVAADITVPETSVGDTLSCTTGNWTGSPTSYSYGWQRAGIAVGEDKDTYLLGPDDAGGQISCIVTATNAIGSTVSPPSNIIQVK